MKPDIGDWSYQAIPGAQYDFAELSVCLILDDEGTVDSLDDFSMGAQTKAQAAVDSGEAIDWVFSLYWHLPTGGVEYVASVEKTEFEAAERLYHAMMCAVAVHRGDVLVAAQFAQAALEAK